MVKDKKQKSGPLSITFNFKSFAEKIIVFCEAKLYSLIVVQLYINVLGLIVHNNILICNNVYLIMFCSDAR